MKILRTAMWIPLAAAALLLTVLPVRAVDPAPLALTVMYDDASGTATVTVTATEQLAIANYGFTLCWDDAVFSLTQIGNGQPTKFTAFVANTETGQVSAYGGGGMDNVALDTGETLAIFTLAAATAPEAEDYGFELTVNTAADVNGDTLGWKGARLNAVLQTSGSTLSGMESSGSSVTLQVRCSVSAAKLICAAYDRQGRPVSLRMISPICDGAAHSYTLDMGTADFQTAKVFLVGPSWIPLCASVKG